MWQVAGVQQKLMIVAFYPFIAVFVSALIIRRQFSVTHSLPIALPAERYHS
jgi:hypothetical protein